MNVPDDSPPQKKLSGQTIVLLEDDDLVRRATERLLRRFGAEVVAGASSRKVLEDLPPATLPSFVIADYWLTREEDGIAAALAIREALGAPIKSLILTGDTSEAVQARIASLGFQLLRKPVKLEDFLVAIGLED
jgi:CheY-like chemotaxis protein